MARTDVGLYGSSSSEAAYLSSSSRRLLRPYAKALLARSTYVYSHCLYWLLRTILTELTCSCSHITVTLSSVLYDRTAAFIRNCGACSSVRTYLARSSDTTTMLSSVIRCLAGKESSD